MDTTRRHHQRATADERRFLDALVFWRALYARRGPQDRTPVESIANVIAEAAAAMRTVGASTEPAPA